MGWENVEKIGLTLQMVKTQRLKLQDLYKLVDD